MPFGRRARLAERLRTGRLARWAELIGRFRQMADGERARKVENATGELVGVTLGDDLSRVIPSELVNLGLPELRAVFAARARRRRTDALRQPGRADHRPGRDHRVRGHLALHVRGGARWDHPEAWSKACALALLDQARHAGRDFVGILFAAADKLQVFRFPADRSRRHRPGHRVRGDLPRRRHQLPEAADGGPRLLAEEFNDAARRRGDIVMLTDDDCGVTEEWMRGWNDAKHLLGFRVFGVAIGAPRVAEADSVLDALCDNLRSVEDFTDVHAVADLFRVI